MTSDSPHLIFLVWKICHFLIFWNNAESIWSRQSEERVCQIIKRVKANSAWTSTWNCGLLKFWQTSGHTLSVCSYALDIMVKFQNSFSQLWCQEDQKNVFMSWTDSLLQRSLTFYCCCVVLTNCSFTISGMMVCWTVLRRLVRRPRTSLWVRCLVFLVTIYRLLSQRNDSRPT